MRATTKEDVRELRQPAQTVWQMLLPITEDDTTEANSLRVALRQANIVIKAQEERLRKLEEMALTDELTGLANRRAFMAAFAREMALVRRDESYGGLLVMVDLDEFKAVNDKWGHPAGDAYLRVVAEVLREELRDSDIVARIGGDEFALLLPHMDEESGAKRIAKLEENFSRRAAAVPESIPLRASFGFAPYAATDTPQAVMRLADLRLYGKKKAKA